MIFKLLMYFVFFEKKNLILLIKNFQKVKLIIKLKKITTNKILKKSMKLLVKLIVHFFLLKNILRSNLIQMKLIFIYIY